MPTVPNDTNAALSKAGNEVDAVLKPKVTVRIWVVLAVALAANLLGVFLHL